MDGDGLGATAHATAAREHVFDFNRITMWERDRIPAETSDQLAEFADIAAALPQACSQLSSALEQAQARQELSMDSMTKESDPSMAIGVARLHLEEARGLAVDLYKHLNAARNATAYIISQRLGHPRADDLAQDLTLRPPSSARPGSRLANVDHTGTDAARKIGATGAARACDTDQQLAHETAYSTAAPDVHGAETACGNR